MGDGDFAVDLTNCDREPIHLLGAVQSFGCLVAVSADWMIARVSVSIERFAGQTPDALLGQPADALLTENAIHALRNRLTMLRSDDANERIFGLALFVGRPDSRFDCAVHRSGDHIVIEAEPSEVDSPREPGGLIRGMVSRLDSAPDMATFFQEGARQIRALTGFDRVMVYRFDRTGSGEVVAEAKRSGIGSFLGLNYPAADIPKQARTLYLRSLLRIIADVDDTGSPLLPAAAERSDPLDLSLSVLRSVSPIHLEYLRNMGVRASMSISICHDGRLWGLFACHHYAPLRPSFDHRTVAELFGQMFALKLEVRERRETSDYEVAARQAGDRLLSVVASDVSLLDDPDWFRDTIQSIIPCDGIAISIDGKIVTGGLTPPEGAIAPLIRWLNTLPPSRVHTTEKLCALFPPAEDYASVAAGMLAVPVSRTPRDYVLLFRQERIKTVRWAGNPEKSVTLGPNGQRLTPRASFDEWREEVRHRSLPFTDAELRVAEMLRGALIEVVLRLSEDAAEDRKRASERQELLIAELNHRVRNILALIRGLIRQSGRPEMTAADYVAMLEGRVEALARAHDQITLDHWGPAPLHNIFDAEAQAYLGLGADRIRLEGPEVLIAPTAYATLALVIHELTTNSAKYGSLSDSGYVAVKWAVDEAGNLAIDWCERGGPAVQAPTRQGFGSTIIRRSIPHDLGGKAKIDFKLRGLEAHLEIPARYVERSTRRSGAAAPRVQAAPAAGVVPALTGRVLLVEDSVLIAMDAEDMLRSLGATEVVSVASVAHALAEIRHERPVVAVLDVNLHHETSFPIADRLRLENVPYVFATGYGEQLSLPPEHEGTPIVQKPYTATGLAKLLDMLGN